MDVIVHEPVNGVVTLQVTGEIDLGTAGALDAALAGALAAAGVRRVLVDFAGVTYCDSVGIAALDSAYGAATGRHVTLRVVNVQPAVRRILQLTGVLEMLTGT